MLIFNHMKLFTILLLICLSNTYAASVREGSVEVELVSSVNCVSPGETIDIALRIKHDKGWHTYWKSPGIVGVPTGIDWKLPNGIEVSNIMWPQPQNVKMGPYNAYGYNGEIFLIMQLKVSAKAKPESSQLLKARASWMCCSKTCQPGFADLILPIKISNQKKVATSWSTLIKKSKASFPVPLKEYKTEAIRSGKELTLHLIPASKKQINFPKSLQFFSSDGLIHSDVKQIVKKLKNGSIQMVMSISEFGPKNQNILEGILYSKGGYDESSNIKPYHVKTNINFKTQS